ncbi:S1C family serine protease [Marinicella sediminis]|uniref:S1C family serine protease n=1 Tax=Marinicella sediminis TaxID=1792834 RepID=A0ABV7J971_9GAMM|nr:trypsin-like peptidase domain-containing protein [Marinicella sediminis]
MLNHLTFFLKYALLGLLIGLLYLFLTGQLRWVTNEQQPALVFSYAPAIDTISRSVVSIYTQSNEPINGRSGISPRSPYRTKNYLGSGVVVSENGHIVTNKHVIKDASRVVVYLWDNQLYEASFIGADTLTDLALIKIDADNLTPAAFADSELLNTGDVVLAVGNPYGLNQSASLGIVSATGRRGLTESQVENFIQTDAAINLGNSGGALVNPLGQVVGISTASYSQIGAEGINFAIPSNTTVQIINSIIRYGQVLRGWLGIYFIQPYGHVVYQIPKPVIGIMVSKTREGSSADLAGIKPRDVITHINDKPVNSFSEYQNQLLQNTVGDSVKVTGYNDNGGFEMYLTIELPPSVTLQEGQ